MIDPSGRYNFETEGWLPRRRTSRHTRMMRYILLQYILPGGLHLDLEIWFPRTRPSQYMNRMRYIYYHVSQRRIQFWYGRLAAQEAHLIWHAHDALFIL